MARWPSLRARIFCVLDAAQAAANQARLPWGQAATLMRGGGGPLRNEPYFRLGPEDDIALALEQPFMIRSNGTTWS
jgi:hypothetical protein